MNAVLTVTRNCLLLTRSMYVSVLRQSVPTYMLFIDNGSDEETRQWIAAQMGVTFIFMKDNTGVSAAWNSGLRFLFSTPECKHVLVVNNDVELAPWTYELLLSYDLPFVTGVASDDRAQIEQSRPSNGPLEEHPDFSMFLIRRDAWEQIGYFDERMVLYAQDCDYHIRGFRLGVPMMKACVPYYHVSSGTLKNSPPEDQQKIYEQANRDRAVFESIYHCLPGTPEYYKLFEKVAL